MEQKEKHTTGTDLKHARYRAGLTQKELAKKAGVGVGSVANCEKFEYPSPRMAAKIGKALGITVIFGSVFLLINFLLLP